MVHVGSCLLEMLLHSCFEVLLGGSNVEFVGETVHDLVNYQFVSAHVVVVTCCGEFVAAVAGEVLVVSRDISLLSLELRSPLKISLRFGNRW